MKQVIKRIINKIIYKQKIKFHGKNNEFICPDSGNLKNIKINVWGDNNKIIIGDNAYINNAKILIGFSDCEANNCVVKIGNNTGANSLNVQIGEDDSAVIIGENCAISYDVELNCTDTHSILDNEGKLLNIGKNIVVGDNVWLCKEVRIMKNTNIPNGCIVAQGSIVTKKFEKENCVIADNPSKIVKENIKWDAIRPNKNRR